MQEEIDQTQVVNDIDFGAVATELGLSIKPPEQGAKEEVSAAQALEKAEDCETHPAATTEDEVETTENDLLEAENKEDGVAEEESEEKSDESKEAAKSEATLDKLLNRIDTVTAKRKDAEERIKQLEQELSDLQNVRPSTNAIGTPLDLVESEDQLEEAASKAESIRAWALRNFDGATIQGEDGKEVFLEPEKVREYFSRADELLRKYVPIKREWFKERAPVLNEVKEVYPDVFKAGTELHKIMTATVRQYPALKQLPWLEMLVGDAWEGMKLRFARQQAKSKPKTSESVQKKTAVQKAPSVPQVKGKVHVPAKTVKVSDAISRVFEGNASRESIAEMIEKTLLD